MVIHISKRMSIHKIGLTMLMTKGAMLSTRATPPRVLFFLETAYIRSAVNTDLSRQWVLLGRVSCILTRRSDIIQVSKDNGEPDNRGAARRKPSIRAHSIKS